MAENRTDPALALFRDALREQPPVGMMDWFEDCLGDAFLKLGKLEDAVSEYQRVLTSGAAQPIVHYHLAQAYERQGLSQRARSEYRRFLDLWSHADKDTQEFQEAERRLHALS